FFCPEFVTMEKSSCFGQTRTTGFIWSLLAALLLWHSPASAEIYSWRYNDQQFPSANAACEAHMVTNQKINPHVVSFKVNFRSETNASCVLLNAYGNSLGSA